MPCDGYLSLEDSSREVPVTVKRRTLAGRRVSERLSSVVSVGLSLKDCQREIAVIIDPGSLAKWLSSERLPLWQPCWLSRGRERRGQMGRKD